jgi:hypothetical protein
MGQRRRLARVELRHPRISFGSGHMLPRCLILGPGGSRLAPELLAPLLALDILLDGFAHQPM